MIWGRLGPVFVLFLVLVMGSSSCLAAHVPSSRRRRPAVSRHRERLAGPGRGGRKPQQTRHGAWRSHGSPARKGVLRPAPLARWEQTPTRCPSHCCAHCRVPTTHCSNPLFSPVPRPLPQPIPLFSFPHPTNVSVHCPIPLFTPLCRHPPPHSRSHNTLLLPLPRLHSTIPRPPPELLALLQLIAARSAPIPLIRPTALPTLPFPKPQHPRPQPLFPPLGCLKYRCSVPTSPLHSLALNCANRVRTVSPAPVLSAPVEHEP